MIKKTLAYDIAIAKELKSAIDEDERLNTLQKVQSDVIRVMGDLRPKSCLDWLQGLALGVKFCTYDICSLLCEESGENIGDLSGETMSEMDEYYWRRMSEMVSGYEK